MADKALADGSADEMIKKVSAHMAAAITEDMPNHSAWNPKPAEKQLPPHRKPRQPGTGLALWSVAGLTALS